jgi:prevent-host-death family protein
METIGAFEAKTHLSSLLERVAKGETFTITRHGTPIAILSPVRTDDQARREAAVDRLLTFGKGRRLGMEWRDLRDAGHRY